MAKRKKIEKRFNLINVVIGRRGSGKTYFIKKFFKPYLQRGMKIVIVDTFNHPSYAFPEKNDPYPYKIGRIQPSAIPAWEKDKKNGIYRMYGNNFNTEILPALMQLRNTLIVFEDAKKYIKQNLQEDLESLCIDSKQKNIDIIFLYHSWGFVPPAIIRLSDFIELFPTSDSPHDRKSYISGVYNEAVAAHNKVRASKDKWPHVSIDLRN